MWVVMGGNDGLRGENVGEGRKTGSETSCETKNRRKNEGRKNETGDQGCDEQRLGENKGELALLTTWYWYWYKIVVNYKI
jgi:hypothetical protein